MRRAPRALGLASATLASLLALGCVAVAPGERHEQPHPQGFTDNRSTVQVVNTKIGTKVVFIPSTIVVTEGTGRTLTVFNDTDAPHGFRIPALGVETVLAPGQDTVVALPPLEGGNIYEINCQLHPPHRHASLVVVLAR